MCVPRNIVKRENPTPHCSNRGLVQHSCEKFFERRTFHIVQLMNFLINDPKNRFPDLDKLSALLLKSLFSLMYVCRLKHILSWCHPPEMQMYFFSCFLFWKCIIFDLAKLICMCHFVHHLVTTLRIFCITC